MAGIRHMVEHEGYVQYGCGLCAPQTWLNFDASPTLRLQRLPLVGRVFTRVGPVFPAGVRYGDIVKGLPVAGGSCRAVYCSHVLEHLSLEDCRRALRNTYACLRPGGVFRFVLPDLEWLARQYLDARGAGAAIRFMEESKLGLLMRPRRPGELLRAWLGNSQHLWMWDENSMSAELEAAGFRQVRRAAMGDSSEPRFRDVEDPGRWENCLGMECVRPETGR
jgi:hypothetical protein